MIRIFRKCARCAKDHVKTHRGAYAAGTTASLALLTLDAYASTNHIHGLPGMAVAVTIIIAKAKLLHNL